MATILSRLYASLSARMIDVFYFCMYGSALLHAGRHATGTAKVKVKIIKITRL